MPSLQHFNNERICYASGISFKVEKNFQHGNCISHWNEKEMFESLLKCYPDLAKFNYSKDACSIFNQDKIYGHNNMNLLQADPNCKCQSKDFKPLQCPRQCQETLYDEERIDMRQENEREDDMKIQLFIMNQELASKNITESPAMSFEQLVGNFGGVLGLWLGASFLTLVEVVEFFTNVVINAFSKIVRKRSAVNTGVDDQSTDDETGMTIEHYNFYRR